MPGTAKTFRIAIDDSGKRYLLDVPNQCPYCGAYCDPKHKSVSVLDYDKAEVLLSIFHVRCCDKDFFCTYMKRGMEQSGAPTQLLNIYPPIQPSHLSDAINELSPRFVELYNQSYWAEQSGFFELSGSGYRNALEVLIKDYAKHELGKSDEDVKIRLAKAIDEFVPGPKLKDTADVVRILGNDYTHYERRYKHTDLNTLKTYLTIFMDRIEAEYLSNHLPVDTHRSDS